MSIEKTIEAIRELGDGDEVGNYEWDKKNQQWRLIDILEVDGLKALADGYDALAAENAELREALGHYAEPMSWICCQPSYLHNCREDKCWMTQYEGDGQGWDIAQAVLDKYKSLGP